MNKKEFKHTEIGEIPKGWDLRELGSLGHVVTGKTPPTKDADSFGEGYPFITPRDMTGQKYVRITERFLSEKGKSVVKNCLLSANSVCVSCIGSDMGKVVMTDRPSITNQQLNSIVCEHVDSHFVYYGILNIANRLRDTAFHSTAVPILNKSAFSRFQIPIPTEYSEQRAIAKILSDLDEKIELNHRMNKTLEFIAQTIFKRWFVDFEFPGYEKVKFVNGLPDGWSEGTLIDVCDIVMGQSPPGETYNESENGVVFYQGNRDFGFRFPTPRIYCTDPTRIAEAGDVLISVRAPVGALNITLERCAIGRGVAALRMKQYSNGFLFYFLSARQDLWDRLNSEGTVFGCLNKTEFHKIVLPIPTDVVMRQFDVVVKPIEEMIRKNELENRALGNIRDSLLPRLMAGKMRVKI